jgi:hypothetical protein
VVTTRALLRVLDHLALGQVFEGGLEVLAKAKFVFNHVFLHGPAPGLFYGEKQRFLRFDAFMLLIL